MRKLYSPVLALLLTGALAGVASAGTGFTAILSGANEVPPTASTGSGTAVAILDNSGTQLACTVTFTGLTSGLTASHIHIGAAGTNGPVLFPFTTTSVAGMTSGTFSQTFTLTAQNVSDLQNGLYYVNIHTSTYPGGEIRGQLGFDVTPTNKTSWGRIKNLYR